MSGCCIDSRLLFEFVDLALVVVVLVGVAGGDMGGDDNENESSESTGDGASRLNDVGVGGVAGCVNGGGVGCCCGGGG